MSMYIETLKAHVKTPLYRAGIQTDEALVVLSYEELLRIRNIGHSAIQEINEKVRIPMGKEPLVRPASKGIHPNRKAGIDSYWERYREGNAINGRNRRRNVRV